MGVPCGGHVDDAPRRFFEKLFAAAVGGKQRAVAGQSHAEGLIQAVHGIGGEHARTGAAGRAGAALDPGDIGIAHRIVGGHDHGIDQVEALLAVDTCLHGAAGDKDRRDVEAHGGHQHAGSDLIAVADADHRINGMGVTHIFDAVGYQLAGWQGVEHARVAHGDAVVDGYGVEFSGKTTGLGDDFFQVLTDCMQMHVAGYELGEGIDDADNRFAELLFLNPVGTPETAGAGHSASFH